MRSFENHDMLRLSLLIDNFILILFIYWSGSLYNIFSGSIFILMLYKLPFLFDLFTLHTLAKSMILLWIVLGFFFKEMQYMWHCRKTSCKFWSCEIFLQCKLKSQRLIFYSYTLSTMYMQNFLLYIFFYSFYTHKVLRTCVLIDEVRCAFIWFVEQHLLVFDNFKISAINLILSL